MSNNIIHLPGKIDKSQIENLDNAGGQLSDNYAPSTGVNDALFLTGGDTYEQAFSKLEKVINDNELITANAIAELYQQIQEGGSGGSSDILFIDIEYSVDQNESYVGTFINSTYEEYEVIFEAIENHTHTYLRLIPENVSTNSGVIDIVTYAQLVYKEYNYPYIEANGVFSYVFRCDMGDIYGSDSGNLICVISGNPNNGLSTININYDNIYNHVPHLDNNSIFFPLDGNTSITPVTQDTINKYKLYPNYSKHYLTFEAITAGTITIQANNASVAKTIFYSVNNGNYWSSISTSTTAISISVSAGDKVLFKGTNTTYGTSSYYNQFGGTAQVKVYGNIMSLIYGDNFEGQTTFNNRSYVFRQLFYNYTNLISAENLILPAITLTQQCYAKMFTNCTSLTTMPNLPATTLGQQCYSEMFKGCTNLVNVCEILPATSLSAYCYASMFGDCSKITTAPILPATGLYNYCYQYMFENCSKLNYIKALFTSTPNTNNNTTNWVKGVGSTGIFIKADNATWNVTGVNGVPTGWNTYTESEYKEVKQYQLKTINGESLLGSGNITVGGAVESVNGLTGAVTISPLPTVTSADNGKILMVVDGAWALVTPVSIYSGSGTPSNSQGNNGDIYVQV